MQLTPEQLDALAKEFRLSPRETQVLDLLLQGMPTDSAIAERLATTPGAVKAAVRMLMAKTTSSSRHELATRSLTKVYQRELSQMRERVMREVERVARDDRVRSCVQDLRRLLQEAVDRAYRDYQDGNRPDK